MALNNNFIPQTSLVFAPRDFSQQIAQQAAADTKGLQNAFKFGTQVYDFVKQNQIADAIKDGDVNKAAVLDAQRINNQDPTSLFRWKQGLDLSKQLHDENLAAQQEMREADIERSKVERANEEQKQRQALSNKITNTLGTMGLNLNTSPEQVQEYMNTLATLKTEAENNGIPLEAITRKEAELQGRLPYDDMMDLVDEMEELEKNFDKGGDFGSNRNFKTFEAKMQDVWNRSSRDMRENRDFRNKYKELLTKRRPNTKKPVKRMPK